METADRTSVGGKFFYCDEKTEVVFPTLTSVGPLWLSATSRLYHHSWHISLFVCCLLFKVCQHPHTKMREWGAEAVTSLVRSALTHDHDPPLKQDLVSHVVDIIGQPRCIAVVDHSTRLLLNGERMDGHWERKKKD